MFIFNKNFAHDINFVSKTYRSCSQNVILT